MIEFTMRYKYQSLIQYNIRLHYKRMGVRHFNKICHTVYFGSLY